MKKRILGLDTGTNSLGWAVVDRDEESGEYALVDHGVIIFQEGVKIEKGIESSRAAERTAHRALRRQYFRRRLRKIEVLRVLVAHNLCPHLSDEELHEWHVHKRYPRNDDFMLWQRTSDNEDKNPYYYRHLCLHRQLDLHDIGDRYILGRALYHLAQRRGFLSNRLEQTDEKETGKVKDAITGLSDEMRAAGCEYLGDYFFRLYSEQGNRVRLRSRYTDREEHYKREFHAICRKQGLDEQLTKELERALYFQRPLKSQRQGVGKCTFEPRCPRCADSHPDFEEFRRLCFLNSVRVQGPYDFSPRPLDADEIRYIGHFFYRKSKSNFDFEDIAKAIAGKNNYQHMRDKGNKPYKFNFRMTQGVADCPTTAQLKKVFGDDWRQGIAETYTLNTRKDGTLKTAREMADDIWNVLYSFADKEHLVAFAKDKLQLDDEKAEKFSKIRLTHNFASLSLKAIRKILPFLREGMIYSHAVAMANIPSIVGEYAWEEKKDFILENVKTYLEDKDLATKDFCIKGFLQDNFSLDPGAAERLYHPSMIETYQDARRNEAGVYQLGSPRTSSVRNPMAMRSLHELRKVVNALLKAGTIDENTEVHIEYARELNDSNKRQSIMRYNKELENRHKQYEEEIKKLYKEETGKDIVPTEAEVQKFQFWEEQEHICLYTGKRIGIADFIGANPKFDIEHTVPRSVGGESTMENLTLCESRFNREEKKAQLPSALANHDEILVRLEPWKEKYEELSAQIDRLHTNGGMDKAQKDRILQKKHLLRLKRDYWRGKYERFTMTEEPEGFSRRQGAGIGLVSKYAGLYLKSLFHKKGDRNKSNVYVVKGSSTAEFRQMWGLQSQYEKKSRDNHIHHCIDAITIACIGKAEYDKCARYYREEEAYDAGRAKRPQFPKPWPTFTEDVLGIEQSLLVAHDTPDNMKKHARKTVRTPRGKFLATGDSARGSLHLDTYYGAIEREGKVRYVVRKPLSSFTSEKDLDQIVDETVKQVVKDAVAGKKFAEAIKEPIYMNKEKGIRINKVRVFVPSVTNPLHIRKQRDVSRKDYKQQFLVANDLNYMLAIYEGEVKGKPKREFEIVNNLEAADYYKQSMDRGDWPDIVPERSTKNGFPLYCKLKTGTHVLLYEKTAAEIDFANYKDLDKRLYKVSGMSSMTISGSKYAVINLRYHQEARASKDVKAKNGAYKNGEEHRAAIIMLHTQLKALVEGKDFRISELGKITPINI
ncbi:CRISPR-associated protein Csn1 [Prevotella sp. oral taxon 376]|uniref:type II CRISPR RNA-guided endonuclease Cas9 n=1 Tax=Prevotella sp. oral taxon 376 TaxID=712466 RepID=UPI000D1E3EDB|nr:type II CRISPR RNA-guided endonuclease Cas9 [Prevotella sp. oral taxon 376]PTL33270.1 CRISPR-associated protein Csn1 [Prevotella sp. oral taxon 376]